MLQGLMVSVWSTAVRTTSPWLMSRVHAVPLNVTLLARANGLLSLAASWLHCPAMLVDVHERNQRRPSEPIASTSNRYWLVPCTLYTLDASKSRLRESCIAMTVLVIPLGKLPRLVCDRYRWPL